MNTVYIALGTNIEPRETYLREGLAALDANEAVKVTKQSSIYETVPVGYTEQNDFLNMVIEVETTLKAMALLDFLQSIEADLGRKRDIRFGPRTIDLDILTYNHENSTVERLILPHPRLHERAFVLVPFEEIAAGFQVPVQNRSVAELKADLSGDELDGVKMWKER